MGSNVLFNIMVIFAMILIFVASITCTFGAEDAFSSPLYNTNSKLRSAYQYLYIAGALGWSSLILTIIIIIIAYVLSSNSLTNPTPKDISVRQTTHIIILIVLIIIAIVTLIIGILASAAVVQISEISQKDDQSQAAYTQAIIAAVSSISAMILIFVAIVAYAGIQNSEIQPQVIQNSGIQTQVIQNSGIQPQVIQVIQN